MKIILDTDGTLTDFNAFIEKYAISYFEKKGYNIINEKALEIEDIFDMKNTIMEKQNCSEEQAIEIMKKELDGFWVGFNFVKFSLLNKFRPGVKEVLKQLQNEGHELEVHSSRAKTCDSDIIGTIARKFTMYQYWLNGVKIPKDKFYFYRNDEDKIKGIKNSNPAIVFDDKPEIIKELNNNNIKTICVSGKHNSEIESNKECEKIDIYSKDLVAEKIERLLGVKNFNYYNRAAKSDKTYYKLSKRAKSIISHTFNPIVLHPENIVDTSETGVIYAPNHRSTLDPIAINAVIDKPIHWVALKRFFDGTDSIFNNSKKPILCKITSKFFKSLEYIPIERKWDNPAANNMESIRDMSGFLKINQKIGIFPEGTTRREENEDFGTFDEAFITLGKSTGSVIQPITVLWTKEEKEVPGKLIINFGKAFSPKDMDRNEALEHYLNIQKENLEENKQLVKNLTRK